MERSYANPWIPAEAIRLLKAHSGSILDVGGGAAPYARASHIIDILPFSSERLTSNAWPGTEQPAAWTDADYTCCDIISNCPWPFDDNQFDLGLSSHCLEDLRDPIPVVREMSRVCRNVLIICPSRLLEQTMGIDHPRTCGFYHHPWMVSSSGSRLVFRRKTLYVQLPGAHLRLPPGRTLRTEDASMFAYGDALVAEEDAFWSDEEDYQDYVDFLVPYRHRAGLFVSDGKGHGPRFWIRYLRRRLLGAL